MIGLAITALSMLAATSPLIRPTTVTSATASSNESASANANATANANANAVAFPSLKMPKLPKISMPKFHMPHFPKREHSGDPMQVTARRLESMVREQEAWYAGHSTYTTNAGALVSTAKPATAGFEKVQVQVLYAGKKGWTAMASHPDAPGKSCVIYVGYRSALPMIPRTRTDAVDAAQEAKAACDN